MQKRLGRWQPSRAQIAAGKFSFSFEMRANFNDKQEQSLALLFYDEPPQ
jgi:hypothetical protein